MKEHEGARPQTGRARGRKRHRGDRPLGCFLADQLLVPLHLFFGRNREWDGNYECWIDNWSLAIQKETSHYTTNGQVISAF